MTLLTRKQIALKEKRLKILETSKASLVETLSEEARDFKTFSGGSLSASLIFSRETIASMDREIAELRYLLATAKEPAYDAEKIEVGTNFSAAINVEGKIIEEKYTLVQISPENDNDERMQISIDSPFGKAVHGKRENEVFKYKAPSGIFDGVITSIEPVKEKVEKSAKAKQKTIGTHPSTKRGK